MSLRSVQRIRSNCARRLLLNITRYTCPVQWDLGRAPAACAKIDSNVKCDINDARARSQAQLRAGGKNVQSPSIQEFVAAGSRDGSALPFHSAIERGRVRSVGRKQKTRDLSVQVPTTTRLLRIIRIKEPKHCHLWVSAPTTYTQFGASALSLI